MADQSFDLVVIGSGPGGYVAAIRAAQLGLKTAVVERQFIGGRCLNVACIPAKAVLRSADVLSEIAEAEEFGISAGEPSVNWDKVSERRQSVISTLTGGVGGLLKKNGVEVIEGSAKLDADGNVEVEGVGKLTATKGVVLATGSVRKALPGIEYGERIIGTEEAWALPGVPETLAVVGAGASGTEIASAYARFGSKVTLLEGLDRVLHPKTPTSRASPPAVSRSRASTSSPRPSPRTSAKRAARCTTPPAARSAPPITSSSRPAARPTWRVSGWTSPESNCSRTA